MKNDASLKALLPLLAIIGQKFRTYMSFFIFLLLAVVYGFIIMRINHYSNPIVTDNEVSGKVAASPASHIDEKAVDKLRSLEDNSVNVQTLFEDGRTNPFDE